MKIVLMFVLCAGLLSSCQREESSDHELLQEITMLSEPELEFGNALDFVLTRSAPSSWPVAEWTPVEFNDASLRLRSRSTWLDSGRRFERLNLRLHAYALGSVQWEFPWSVPHPQTGKVIHAEAARLNATLRSSLTNGQESQFEWLSQPPAARSFLQRIAPAVVFLFAFALLAKWQRRTIRPDVRTPHQPDSFWRALQTWQAEVDRGQRDLAEVLRMSRAKLREMLPERAWSGSQLVVKFAQRFGLAEAERRALTRFVAAAEQREFAAESRRTATQLELDTAWDDLAIALRAIDEASHSSAKESAR